MNIHVAIPVYDGKVPVEVARSLLNEKAAAHLLGDDLIVEFLPGCSHPGMGRNQLAQAFMDSNYDRLIFLDSDISWEPGQLLKLARWPVEFVGGCYRYKKGEEGYPIGWLPDPELKGLYSNALGLIEVASLPGGFMSLARSVFEKIRAANPDRQFEHMGKEMFCYFEMPYTLGRLWGEDGFFCKTWRELGEKIYLDPTIELTHWDFSPVPYKGSIGNWLGGMRPQVDSETEKAGRTP